MSRRTHPPGSRTTARATATTAAALLVILVGIPAQSASAAAPQPPAPPGDAFYTPPQSLPDSEPGDILRWRPASAGANAANADAWQVMYRSTDATGKPNAVTGTVLVPKGVDPAKADIVGFGVGTQGPAFKCAPSQAMERGTLYDQPAINDALSSGHAVAVTDYEGYEPGGSPTYIAGQSQGPAMIDSVRAAQRLPQAKLSPKSKVVFQGYSQGGGAAMWAGEKQPQYAPDLDLVGVVGGGVPGDLNKVADGLNGKVGFGFLAFAAIGLDATYPELNLDSYLNDKGRNDLGEAKKNDCVIELLSKYPGKKIADYTTRDPLPTPEWQARLEQNKLGKSRIRVPVMQYHATADEIVDEPQADELHKTYCSKGVPVTWKTYVSDHLSGIFAGNADAHQYIEDRFQGKPSTSNC